MPRALFALPLAATLTLAPDAAAAQGGPCTHDLATHADALFCRAYDDGGVYFRTSMQNPATIWDWRGSMEVVVFDNYMVVIAAGDEFIVPRGRMIYAGSRNTNN